MRACVAMLARLTAEESLLMRDRVAMGTGSFDTQTARSVMHRWTQQTTGGRRERAAKATPDILAGAGIGVTVHG
jgi:hypothetical protein